MHQSRRRKGGHSPPPQAPMANERPKAGRPEDIRIDSTTSLLPAHLRKGKKKAAETQQCHSQCKARPHPAEEPMAQRRTDKDIPWEILRPITGGRGGTIAIC